MTDTVMYYYYGDTTGVDINSSVIKCNYMNAINFKFDIDKDRDEFQEREFTITFVCNSYGYSSLLWALAQDMPPKNDPITGERLYATFNINGSYIYVIPCGIESFYHRKDTNLYKLTVRFFSKDTLWSNNLPAPPLY